ncbi:hypothetical protein ASD19_01530 [Microbacterium sp. Root53]|uniref:sensor histidine kinase n=1 Tax=Microbacterium sp. Root53 TaxID=1736553 RepID=UPI0006F7A918|nr:histidine kinase [Microbacterium sp. Root53]KQZ11966.1 hypothetical protein ASD19_01530 [Microbacterium sp. Root53]
MTTAVRPRPGRIARLLDGGWSTGLFVLGALWDILCVMNVPGAAVFRADAERVASITDVGTLLALAALLAWTTVYVRARAPQVVLIAGAVLMAIGVSYLLALVGVFHALMRWPKRTGWIAGVTAAGVAAFVLREVLTDWGAALPWLFGARTSDPGAVGWTVAPWLLALVSLAALAGLVALQRSRRTADAHRARAEREHRRAETLDEKLARQAERERIARDLHDGLGHRLASAALSASAFEAQVSANPTIDPSLGEWARAVREQTRAALDDVRGVVGGLRSEGRSPAPASLRLVGQLLGELRAAGHRIDAFVMVEGSDRVGTTLDAAAYRILQESLTNAIKHAPGAPVSVTLDASPERGVRIRVENPLTVGGAGVPGGGHGIIGIRERAESEGGTAWIGAHEGRFIVDVDLPWVDRA